MLSSQRRTGTHPARYFDRHFQLPALPDDVDVFALAMELGDRVYARSVQLHDEITPRMAEEGMRAFDAYLGLYLPVFLGKRTLP
ncbi:Regulatory protein, TetR [Pseudomonas syringae pv. viburni]|uniref:Regulatory protein, TetR n=1 Tax=Pseudomonas syringae pv. viburni TaxID=251703 RepID=A0A0Q0DPG4_9PSED|nr:Regulatory protein, TetR [Pseudomonas syringae pv. viburni]